MWEGVVSVKAVKANLPQYDLSQVAPQGFTGEGEIQGKNGIEVSTYLARIIHEASRTGFMDGYFGSFVAVIEM